MTFLGPQSLDIPKWKIAQILRLNGNSCLTHQFNVSTEWVNAIIEFSISYHICLKKRMFVVISSSEFPYFYIHTKSWTSSNSSSHWVFIKTRKNDKVLAFKIVIIQHPLKCLKIVAKKAEE